MAVNGNDVGMVVSGGQRWRCGSCYFRTWCPRLAKCRQEQADYREQVEGHSVSKFSGTNDNGHDGIKDVSFQREGLIMRVILRILAWVDRCPTESDHKYIRAMKETEDILHHISRGSLDPAGQMVADIIYNRDNVPYLTTAYEAIAEMNAPIKQRA